VRAPSITITGARRRGRLRATPEGAAKGAAMTGTDVAAYARERPGMSALVLEDGVVYHTYSSYARGLDGLWGAYQWLDRAPKGRNERGYWWHLHDEYESADGRHIYNHSVTYEEETCAGQVARLRTHA
jgi:hypothetical protein